MALVYSCCFWFSLRLGGILIGIFSLLQALMILIGCCFAYTRTEIIKNNLIISTSDLNLNYAKDYLENFTSDPGKYLSFSISITCVYIFLCIMFIYGAYKCNNILMGSYILSELLRLVLLSILVATGLLLIKQNTMDIGLLIGASVAGGFLLLGMFYLWICAANLPILINEMEREEQVAVISKLRQLLEVTNQKTMHELDNDHFAGGGLRTMNPKDLFIVPIKDNSNKSVRIPKQRIINNFY